MNGALSKEIKKWQQDELELVLELVGDFFGRKKECVGAGISGGEPSSSSVSHKPEKPTQARVPATFDA